MASDLLVKGKIRDGRRLLDQLRRDGSPVGLAFWVRINRDGSWLLCLAVAPLVGEVGPEHYRRVYGCLDRIPGVQITVSDLILVAEESTLAREIRAIRDQHPPGRAVRIRKPDSPSFEEAYIYPAPILSTEISGAGLHGARVYLGEDGVALVKQTVKRESWKGERFILDEAHERRVEAGDDKALGEAVRAALEGRL